MDPVKELGWHPVYGQAERRKLGPIREEGDPGRHGRFAAIEERAYDGHADRQMTDVLLCIPKTPLFSYQIH